MYALTVAYSPNFSSPIAFTCMVHQNFLLSKFFLPNISCVRYFMELISPYIVIPITFILVMGYSMIYLNETTAIACCLCPEASKYWKGIVLANWTMDFHPICLSGYVLINELLVSTIHLLNTNQTRSVVLLVCKNFNYVFNAYVAMYLPQGYGPCWSGTERKWCCSGKDRQNYDSTSYYSLHGLGTYQDLKFFLITKL